MKRLEDIPKKQIFEIPEGYFQKLPTVIQSRLAEEAPTQRAVVFRYALPVALAAVMLIGIGIFWFTTSRQHNAAEAIISSLTTKDLIHYLEEDISTEELLDYAQLDAEDAEQIEDAIYDLNLGEENIEIILDEI